MVWLNISGDLSSVDHCFRWLVAERVMGMRVSGDVHLGDCSVRDIQAWSAFDDHQFLEKQRCLSYEHENAWVIVVAAAVLVVAVTQTEELKV